MRDLIDQYLAAGNRVRTSDCSSQINAIIGAAVVVLADAFERFVAMLPDGSRKKFLLEDSTRRALGKLRMLEIVK